MDGSLDDAAWRMAPEIKLRRCTSGVSPTQPTTWQLVWHGDYLYLGVRVGQFDIQDHNSKRDDPVYGEQCVEVFLAAAAGVPSVEGRPYRYLEADVSPTGVLFDARISNPRPFKLPAGVAPSDLSRRYIPIEADTEFDPLDLVVATTINGTVNGDSDLDPGWTLEMQIPFSAPPGGATPQIGEVWRLNLYRIHGWNTPSRELQAWSVVGKGDFHTPQRFGYLRFMGPR